MDLNIVKAKVERIVSELFEETELFESSGRDSDGDYFLERYFNGTTKFYVSVFPIKTFGLPETTWDDLELPEFQVRIWGNVASNLKPGLRYTSLLSRKATGSPSRNLRFTTVTINE